MADFSSLKQTIQSYIKQNGNEEITGNILQDVLLAMVSTMGDSAINGLASALQDETTARQNQDGTLQGNIAAETTARQQADTALGGRIDGLQTAINGINTKLAEGYVYAGIATPSTNPGNINGKVLYIAIEAGTYMNFGNQVLTQGINILSYNGSAWYSEQMIGIDDNPTAKSANLVKSGGVADELEKIAGMDSAVHFVWQDGTINQYNGTEYTSSNQKRSPYISVDDFNAVKNHQYPNYYKIYQFASNIDSSFIGVLPEVGSAVGTYYNSNIEIGTNGVILDSRCKYIRVASVINAANPDPYIKIGNFKDGIIDKKIDEAFNGVDNYITLNWTDGSINQDNGAEITSSNAKRSQFISIKDINTIKDYIYPNYYKIFQYSSESSSSFIKVLPEKGVIPDTYYNRDVVLGDNDVVLDNGCEYIRLVSIINETYPNPYLTAGLFVTGELRKNVKHIVLSTEELIIVDSRGNGDYTTIEDALANVNDSPTNHVTIIVMPGIYYPAPKIYGTPGAEYGPYREVNRNISIIGAYRDACFLRGNVGYYGQYADYALLRLNGNILIKNITFIATSEAYDSTIAEKGWQSTETQDVTKRMMSYCIHCDAPRPEGSVITIENCKMYNDHFACVGWGLRPNATLIIKDCECELDCDTIRNEKSNASAYGTIYGHCLVGEQDAPNQRLEVIDCMLKNNYYSCAIRQLYSGGSEEYYTGTSSKLLFVRNIAKTTNIQQALNILTIPGQPQINAIDDMSFGNNFDV